MWTWNIFPHRLLCNTASLRAQARLVWWTISHEYVKQNKFWDLFALGSNKALLCNIPWPPQIWERFSIAQHCCITSNFFFPSEICNSSIFMHHPSSPQNNKKKNQKFVLVCIFMFVVSCMYHQITRGQHLMCVTIWALLHSTIMCFLHFYHFFFVTIHFEPYFQNVLSLFFPLTLEFNVFSLLL